MADIRHLRPLPEFLFLCGIAVLQPDEALIGDVALAFNPLHLPCGNRAECECLPDEAASPISLLLEG